MPHWTPYTKDSILGYVTGVSDAEADAIVRFVGGDARKSELCAMIMTSDNSPIVVNVPSTYCKRS